MLNIITALLHNLVFSVGKVSKKYCFESNTIESLPVDYTDITVQHGRIDRIEHQSFGDSVYFSFPSTKMSGANCLLKSY